MENKPGSQGKTKPGKSPAWFSKLKEKVIHSDGFFFTLVRSSMSSQLCGWIDTITSFLVFSLFNLTAWLSTAIGAFVGGILNCIINYRFTFHAVGVDWRVALTKFIFIWAGSLLLNSFGTQAVYSLVKGWPWFENVTGIGEDSIFLASRLFVALTVSLCWNFLLQRNFVFRTTRFDPYIAKLLSKLGIGKKSN
ncbi:MAG: GtrA family protein [Muribaculaceae bacterium]|nr:GtrA family protein [Muribaculaceae bacterium]MDE5845361.1 GtrA family protein [Muribaculaceae bacterium]MDE5858615.1 GtrA family protein [Muribaculaceae bacterium]MDE7368212.1 GtrA family protein [Muribaculaceae bacterium]